MNAVDLTKILKDVVTYRNREKLTQSEVGEKLGISQQWVSRLLFLSRTDTETIMFIRRRSMSKTALARLIDMARSKARGRTIKTKVLMFKRLLSEYSSSKVIKETRSRAERKLDKTRLKLIEVASQNFMLREKKKEQETFIKNLQKKVLQVEFDLSLYQMSMKNRGQPISVPKPKAQLTPDQRYLLGMVQTALGGVKVSIQGSKVLLDCMTDDYRDTTLERLCSVRG